MHTHVWYKSTKIITLSLAINCLNLARADFKPIALTPDSFNQDIVIEKEASPPLVPVTTATMDGGLANTDYTWFERGFKPDWPGTGLPVAGSRITSEAV